VPRKRGQWISPEHSATALLGDIPNSEGSNLAVEPCTSLRFILDKTELVLQFVSKNWVGAALLRCNKFNISYLNTLNGIKGRT
jgi:hypothetical protein